MAQNFYGSICLTDLIEKVKAKHSAVRVGKNEKVYVDISLWLNEKTDQYGNVIQIVLNSAKGKRDSEEKVYIGNCKPGAVKQEKSTGSAASAIEKLLK